MTEEGYAISDHPEYSSIREKSEILANAKLIAAAPDLLEALIYLLGDVEPCGCESPHDDEYCLINIAEKAIAKATGESK